MTDAKLLKSAAVDAARAMSGKDAYNLLVRTHGKQQAAKFLKNWDPETGKPKYSALREVENLLYRQALRDLAKSKGVKVPKRDKQGRQLSGSKAKGRPSSNAFRNRRPKSAQEKSDPIEIELAYLRERFSVYGLHLHQVSAKFGGTGIAIIHAGRRLGVYYASSRKLYSYGKKIHAYDLATALRLVVDGWGLKPVATKPKPVAVDDGRAPWE